MENVMLNKPMKGHRSLTIRNSSVPVARGGWSTRGTAPGANGSLRFGTNSLANIAGATTGAALAAAATNISGDKPSEVVQAVQPVEALINGIRNFSSDKSGASIEHLKAPLNAAITGWLQSNAPLVNQFFAITGKQPTDMVDSIVSAFRNHNAGASISNVDDVMMGVLETANERANLKGDEHEFKPGYEERVSDTLGTKTQWENVAAGVAILKLAQEALPGGIRSLLAIREALEMEKGFFNEVFERLYGYNPEAYVSSQIDNYQSRVALGIR